MNDKGGRPKAYSNDELLNELEKYMDKHKNEKIIISKLARETGIARHIWDYSAEIKEIINKINNPIILTGEISDNLKRIPSVENLLEQNSNSSARLKTAIETCLNIINSLKEKLNECHNIEKDKVNLESQLIKLKNENKMLKLQIKKQEVAMLELCIDSESAKKRKEKGLKNNVIKINVKENIDKAVAGTEDDIIKEFPWLAD